MVYLVKKEIKGNIYLYLEKKVRVNGKAKRAWQIYLGREDSINKADIFPLDDEFEITTLDFGLPMALMQIVNRLDLIEIIDSIVKKREQGWSVGEYVVLTALNRCVQPTTKEQIKKWFDWTYLGKYFPKTETYINAMAYSNHFHYLTEENIEKIQEKIHERLIKEFHVEMKQLMYDPTNFYTFINPKEGVKIPRHGHSKENRFTLNLVGLSLVCTADGGVPILHDVYPGNVPDASLFKDEFPRLQKRLKALKLDVKEVILTFDKGNISQEAFELIDGSTMQYITSIRPSTIKEHAHLTPSDFEVETLPNGKKIGVLEKRHDIHGKERRLIITHDPNRCKWLGKNLREKVEKRVYAVKEYFKGRLNKRKWRFVDEVEKKIKSLIKTKAYFDWIDYHVKGDVGNVSFSIQVLYKRLDAHVKTLGKSYLVTSNEEMDAAAVAWLFRLQYTIEQAFKYLKNVHLVDVKPIYHRRDDTIRGHLFACILGLLLITLLAREVRREFPSMGILSMVGHLSNITISVIKTRGRMKSIKKINKMTPESKKLHDFLELKGMI